MNSETLKKSSLSDLVRNFVAKDISLPFQLPWQEQLTKPK